MRANSTYDDDNTEMTRSHDREVIVLVLRESVFLRTLFRP